MNYVNKEKREFLRTKVRRLTSIVKHEGAYKLIEEDVISTLTPTSVKDISTGGLRIISKNELMKGAFIDLTIPDIETLDSHIVKCEVIRSLDISTFDDGNHTYDMGLRFIPPNTDYLKKIVELLKTD
jgi:hypothetical protein